MGRTRYLKPDFFINEELGELTPMHRLFFQGLWCYADREGRLKDRPKKLKSVILPYDIADPEKLLNDLHETGFITRYSIDDDRFIQINTFKNHQKIHPQEQESSIPPPIKTTTSRPLPGDPGRSLPGYSTDKSKSKNKSKEEKNTVIDSPRVMVNDGLERLEATPEIVIRIFEAYCDSWGRKKYPLTATRKQWIDKALKQYGLEACLAAIEKFRADSFQERQKFNGIEYIFGKQERIDRWCGQQLFGNKAFNKAQAEHRESIERLELAKQMLKERQARNANGSGKDSGTSQRHDGNDERGETNSERTDNTRRDVG